MHANTPKSSLTPQHKPNKRSSSEAHLVVSKETSNPLNKLGIGSFLLDVKKTQVSKQKGTNALVNPSIRKTYSQSLIEKQNEVKKNSFSGSTDFLKSKIDAELQRLKV